MRCLVSSTLGTSLQRLGSFEEATQAFTDGISAGITTKDTNLVISLYGDLIGLYVERGQLYQAHETCQEALHHIERSYQKHGRYTPGTAHIHFRLSTILRHWNDLEGSLLHAQISNEILEKWGFRYRLNYINLAIAHHSVGDYPRAHIALRIAEHLASQQSTYWVENVKATQVFFWLSEGNLEAASQWALERPFEIEGEIRYENHLTYRTLAHVRLVQGQLGDKVALEEALSLLPRLVKVIEDSGATAYLIQVLILYSLALQVKGETELAKGILNKALTLGEGGGYIRVFIREGKPMKELLLDIAGHDTPSPYLQQILSAFESSHLTDIMRRPISQSLLESLTKRELEVLRTLDSEFTIPEIADNLAISIATLRTHIKRIYRKLDTHSRFEAITKAKKLRLF
jgi:LuxR family maltose regulon positive regulatory protein